MKNSSYNKELRALSAYVDIKHEIWKTEKKGEKQNTLEF